MRVPGRFLSLACAAGLVACGDDGDGGQAWLPTAGSASAGTDGSTGGTTGMGTEGSATGGTTGGPTGGTDTETTGGGACEMWATPWIGGPCGHDDDCAYDGGYCLMEEEGFPCGTCSQACDNICPDLMGAPVTFCVDGLDLALPSSAGHCISQCAPEILGGDGCREGYDCVVLPRFNESMTERSVCVPEDLAGRKTGCQMELDARGMIWEPAAHEPEPVPGNPMLTCTIEDPVWIHSPIRSVGFRHVGVAEEKPVLVDCKFAIALDEMAAVIEDMDGVEFEHIGTYVCKGISGSDSISEHGLGRAIDLYGFTLWDDSYYTLIDHWEHDTQMPTTAAGQWLLDLADTWWANMVFNIILTPNYNAAHDNHFHVDVKEGSMFYE